MALSRLDDGARSASEDSVAPYRVTKFQIKLLQNELASHRSIRKPDVLVV